MALLCAAAGAAGTWNIWHTLDHTLDDAMRVMADRDATPQQREGAHHILAGHAARIIAALRSDTSPNAQRLLQNLHEASGR